MPIGSNVPNPLFIEGRYVDSNQSLTYRSSTNLNLQEDLLKLISPEYEDTAPHPAQKSRVSKLKAESLFVLRGLYFQNMPFQSLLAKAFLEGICRKESCVSLCLRLIMSSKASNLCYVVVHFTESVFSRFNVDDTFTQPFG